MPRFIQLLLVSQTKNPPSSFGHLQDGQGVWRFSDKEKAIKIIRKFDANTPIEFAIGK